MLCWPRNFSSEGRNAYARRRNNDSTELEVKTATQPLWAPVPLNQQAKKGVPVLYGIVDHDYQGEMGTIQKIP